MKWAIGGLVIAVVGVGGYMVYRAFSSQSGSARRAPNVSGLSPLHQDLAMTGADAGKLLGDRLGGGGFASSLLGGVFSGLGGSVGNEVADAFGV
jgi:hypothetical protein